MALRAVCWPVEGSARRRATAVASLTADRGGCCGLTWSPATEAFAWPAVRSQPHDLPVAVAGPPAAPAQLTEALTARDPGALDVRPVADEAAAEAAIAGYTVLNDVTARDWQYRTLQWLQGKTFEATTPLGPELVTPEEAGTDLDLTCAVDGEVVQSANTSDMVFGAVATIAYVSTVLTLHPGDVLALGTPGGVGHARKPPRYLTPGAVLTTTIAGLGECRNTCVPEKRP